MAARGARIEEERPPHDAIEGVSLPRATYALVGHDQAELALLDAYRSGRMHHGWVVAGEQGTGRATLAFRFARFAFANPDPSSENVLAARTLAVSPEHPAARRVAAGTHPNLLHLQRPWDEKGRRYRGELAVEAIRRITPFLGTTAAEEGWRVVIVDPADDMNRSAANAILKNLEEPPKRTIFLLLARSAGALLPTIRSRTRKLQLVPLSPAQIVEVVRTSAPDLAETDADGLALTLAEGSARRWIELRSNDGVELYRLLLSAIERDERPAQAKLSMRAIDAAATGQIVDLYMGYLARRVRRIPEPTPTSDPPAAPLATWAGLWEKAMVAGEEVETYNLDRRQFVLDLLETTADALRQPA